MLIVIDGILDRAQVGELVQVLGAAAFEDGRSTAGSMAREGKRNAQAAPDPAIDLWRDRIAAAATAHPVFHLAAQPKRIIGPLFSRYRSGDAYGAHMDEPVLDGARADLAFTLFLSEPEDYDG